MPIYLLPFASEPKPSQRADTAYFGLFDKPEYQQPLDRYRNGKPIVRISGAMPARSLSISEINRQYDKGTRSERKALLTKFLAGEAFPKPRRTTKSRPSDRVRSKRKKLVRVNKANGTSHLAMRNVVAAPTAPTTSSVGSPTISNNRRPSGNGKAALLGLSALAGAGGIGYLVNRQLNKS
jgi:hypothetical protein